MNESFDVVAAKLADYETGLSDLYAQFARTFIEDREFWTDLSHDEARHAAWINRLRQSVSAGAVRPAQTAVRREAIETAMAYARSLAGRCSRGDINRLQAHALARDIENAVLERKLLDLLDVASDESRNLHEALNRETAAHRDKIIKAMARLAPA